VTFDLFPDDSGAVMTIRVKEKKYSQVRFGWHWHEDYQSEQFVELLDDNVNGIGLEFLTHAQHGPDRQDYHTGLRLDRIFYTYLTARVRGFYRRLDRNLFNDSGKVDGYRDEDRWGLEILVGQQIARLGRVGFGLRLEEVDLHDHRAEVTRRFGLRTLLIESTVESFDRYPFPNRGKRHRFELRFAGKLLGGEVEYSRFFTSLEAYYPFGRYLNFHPKVAVGLSRRGLPASEKFYIGGSRSFAGYRTDQFAGDKLFLSNLEVRFKLPYRFYLSGRFDYGDVYTSTEDVKPKNFRKGLGVALAFDSPIGPFVVAYGGGDSAEDRLYFRAGFEF
jgi:outer membrane protein assembly factor BamA